MKQINNIQKDKRKQVRFALLDFLCVSFVFVLGINKRVSEFGILLELLCEH